MKLLNIESSERPSIHSGSKKFLILSTNVDGMIKLFCYFEGVAKGTMSVFIKDNYIKHADIIEAFTTPKEAVEAAFTYLENNDEIYSWFIEYSEECLSQHFQPKQVQEYIGKLLGIKHLIGEITGYGNMDDVKMQVALELAGIEDLGYKYRHTPSLSPTTIDYVLEETSVLEKLVSFYEELKAKQK